MTPATDTLKSKAAALERLPQIRGRLLSEIPELAEIRYASRSMYYRHAELQFALAVFNAVVALSPSCPWPTLVGICSMLSVGMMAFAESKARAMSRQLHRPASEQIARDLLGLKG